MASAIAEENSDVRQADRCTSDDHESSHGGVAYTAFSRPEKRLIVSLVALGGFFSPFSAFIYFPALKSMASDLSVSLEMINLTVTAYIVVQGIVPSVFGELSENQGRRPVYLLVFAIYLAASLGLAFQSSYGGLLILRMLQSAGSSGTIALAYGVIGDIAPPHERGGYVGIAHIGFNSAPALGPVIGGAITERLDWKWIFRFLTILAGLVMLLFAFFLPETNRSLVKDGSVQATGINRTLLSRIRGQIATSQSRRLMEKPEWKPINPLKCFRLVLHKNTALILSSNAIFYMKYSCMQASLAPVLQKVYNLNTLEVGLCYLAFGAATAVASYGVGKISDYDYRRTAQSHNLSIDKVRGDAIKDFPIEKARLCSIWAYILISSTSTLGYGWALQTETHLSAPLVLQFLVGLTVTGIFNALNTLMVDLHADQPATASAAVSVTRCLLAAIGISVLQLLFDAIGYGWTFTAIAVMCYLTIPLLWIERKCGWNWRVENGRHGQSKNRRRLFHISRRRDRQA